LRLERETDESMDVWGDTEGQRQRM